MNSKGKRLGIALALSLALALGGAVALSPAGASVATNWSKIWKKEIRPRADARYYTKATADAKYQPKGSYAPAGSSYTKAQSDAKYAPAQPLYRGTYMLHTPVAGAGSGDSASISFGATFPTAPVAHYIKVGDPIPAGCSGTATAPNAAAGHLCVFESAAFNAGANRGLCRATTPATCGAADPFGAGIYSYAAGAGTLEVLGSWAARPSGPVVNPGFAPAPKDAVNHGDALAQAPTVR